MKILSTLLLILISTLTPWKGAAQEQKLEKALLWEISENGLRTPSYLYGTIHVIEKEDFFLTQSTVDAFHKCKILALEQAVFMRYISEEAAYKIGKKAYLPNGQTIADVLTKAELDSVIQFAHERRIHARHYKSLLRLQPMYFSGFLFHRIYRKTTGYEKVFLKRAAELNEAKKYILYEGLEEYKNTLAALDSLSIVDQKLDLMEDIRTNYAQFEEVVRLYKDQDIEGIYHLSSINKKQYQTLVVNRNLRWMPKVDKLIRSQPTFIAVGAAHLAGEFGMIQLLRKQGYTVRPIIDAMPIVHSFAPIQSDPMDH
jgi:hypothetical protein